MAIGDQQNPEYRAKVLADIEKRKLLKENPNFAGAAESKQPAATPGQPVNAGVRLGGAIRENAVPALATAAETAANVATLVPRSFLHVGSNIAAGMRGEKGNDNFEAMPFAGKFQPGQPAAIEQPANQTPAAAPITPVAATAPTRLSMPASTRPDRQGFDDPTLNNIPFRVGGNAPQSTAALPPPAPSARPTALQTPGGWMRNEQTGEMLTVGGNRGDKIGAFGADGKPIDKVTPLRLGGASSPGGNYSFQGSPEAAQRFNSAVSPGEYSPEAQAARGQQKEQFLTRQGFEKVDPATGLTPGQMNGLKPAERLGFAKMKSDAQAAKDTNAVAMMNATGQADERKVGLKVKQNELADQEEARGLLAEMDTATPERQQQIDKKLVALGKKQPRAEKEPKVYFEPTYDEFGKQNGAKPFVYDESTGEAKPLRVGGTPKLNFGDPTDQATIDHMRNLKATNPKEYERLKKEYQTKG